MIKISHHVNDAGNDELHVESSETDSESLEELDKVFEAIVSHRLRRGRYKTSNKFVAEVKAED